MGVHGLWQVVHPVARPIALETLGNKKLAIDSSIWLYQFQLAMRDKEGRALANAHILGFLRRITKLLYYGIKPVFVFDGGAPVIKRSTLSKRKHRKRDNVDTLAKTAEKLLAAQMRQAAVSQAEQKQRQRTEGDLIGEDAVYLEDLPSGIAPRGAPQGSGPNHAPQASTSQQAPAPSPPKKKRKDYHKDQYALPALDSPMASRGQLQDPRMATEEELRDFIEDLRPEDLDVDAEWFHGLSTEVQYEILGDLRLKSRQANFRRVEQMRQAATALDFSRAQIKHLMQRNDLTQKLLSVTDDISRAHIKIPIRIAAERNKHYVLVKNTADDGTGGWVLGVRDPVKAEGNRVENAQSGDTGGKRQDKVVKIDVSEDSDTEDTHSVTDEGDFEEVMPSVHKDESSSPDQRRFDAAELLQRRYSPSKTMPEEEPIPQLPVQEPLFSPTKRSKLPKHPEQELNESLLAAAATDATLFNDIANSHLGRPSKIQHAPVASSSKQDPGRSSPQRPPLTGHKSTTTDIRNNLFEQDLSSDSEDADMEEVETGPRPEPAEPVQEPSKASKSSQRPAPAPAQPPKPIAQPRAAPMRATPQQASLNAQAKLRNATSFSSFAQTSGSPYPEPSPIPSSMPFDDGSGDVETERVDQGPSLVSSALAQDPDSDEEFEEVDSNKHYELPIQTAAQQSLQQPHPTAQLNGQSNGALNPSAAAAPPDPPPAVKDQPLFNPPSPPLSPSPSPSTSPAAAPAVATAPEPTAIAAEIPSAGAVADDATAPVHVESPARPSLATALPTQESAETLRAASPAALDEDSDAEVAWSRSPSPASRPTTVLAANNADNTAGRPEDAPDYIPPHFELAPEGRELESDDELDAGDLEEAELTANIRAEEGHFSQFLNDLQHRSLSDMRAEVDAEIAQLEQTRKVDRRNAEEITAQMSKEIMVMLRYFGIPFVVAPMEAEAQCAELTNRSLVDGIITDDSDVFLFGGTRVYKNMFNQNKYVECYLLSDMERELGLSRDKLVQLAHFLGSDYSDGIPGVGPVQGMELMNEFPGEDGLTQFRQWWQKVQTGNDDDRDTHNAFRRRFKKSKKQLFLDEHWPNPQVREAYYKPTVDSNEERFQWGVPDLDGLRGFLAESLGWGVNKVDDLLSPLIKRMQQRNSGVANMQGSLDSFFDVSGGSGRFAPAKANQGSQSQRMQTVIKTWKAKQAELAGSGNQVKSESDEEPESEAPKRQPKRRRAPSRKSTGSSKAARKPSKASRTKDVPPTDEEPRQQTAPADPEASVEAPLPRISRPRHSTRRRVDYAEAGANASSDSEQDAWVDA